MLVDDGLLDYDVPVRHYIPEFELYDPFASKECTLRDMLQHRTGLAEPFSGKIAGFSLQIEPMVEPVVFNRVAG
jgi:CubicO group peptidase (beta-lactamase class C family)